MRRQASEAARSSVAAYCAVTLFKLIDDSYLLSVFRRHLAKPKMACQSNMHLPRQGLRYASWQSTEEQQSNSSQPFSGA